jgi:hypothetical protein
MQNISKDWESNKKKDIEWAKQGVAYAKTLRKSSSFSDAIIVCEKILKEFPDFPKAIFQHGWSLYSEFIKKSKYNQNNNHIYEVANRIISMFLPMDSYSPYVITCIRAAEHALDDRDFNNAIYWLSKIDENGLSKEYLKHKTSNNVDVYWSQFRRYLELTARYLESVNKYKESILVCFRIIRECSNSTTQVVEVNNNIASSISALYAVDGEDLVDSLLVKRGFQNSEIRQAYKKALQRRYQSYVGWNRAENRPTLSPDCMSIERQLAKEILMSSANPAINRTQKISATDLSNFTFCPASYSLQKTYDFGNTYLGNIGTIMHDKQLLLLSKVEEAKKGFYLYATKTKSDYFDTILIDDDFRLSIAPLMHDISISKLLFHGHNRDEQKLFYDESGQIVGCPDYIFQKPDGTIFVVEEKFSLQKPNIKKIDKPYSNHLIQLGTYISLLRDIKASYGYLVYWSYSLKNEHIPYVSNAQLFRVNNSAIFNAEVSSVVDEVKELNSDRKIDFNIKNLNSWKCVNCVTSDSCNHKTGNKNTVTLPYT